MSRRGRRAGGLALRIAHLQLAQALLDALAPLLCLMSAAPTFFSMRLIVLSVSFSFSAMVRSTAEMCLLCSPISP